MFTGSLRPRKQLIDESSEEVNHEGKGETGSAQVLGGKQLLWMAKQYPAPGLYHSAASLPLAQQAACREECDVCRIGQLFIGDLEVDPIRIFRAKTPG